MSIRRTDGQSPVNIPRPTTATTEPAAKNTVKPAATPETATAPRVIEDGFSAAPRPGARSGAVQTPKPQPAGPGRIALDSKEGQAAIQATLAQLNGSASGGGAALRASPTSAAQSFSPRNIERDELGMTHVRMDRMHEGVKVFGEQVISHLDKEGKVASLTGDVSSIPEGLGREKPKLTPVKAMVIAGKDFAAKPDRQPTAERVIYKDASGTYHSAYRVELSQIAGQERPRRMNYLVDANTGKILEKFNKIDGFAVSGNARGGVGTTATAKPTTPPPPPAGTPNDTTLYSGKVDLATKKNADGTFSLQDSTRGKGVVTFDAQNKEKASGQVDFKDTNDTWGEAGDPTRSKAAVDAHYGAEMTYDMYKNVLGRDSLDGAGEKLASYVHVSNDFVNAYWDGKQMNYGDGDGQTAGPLTTLDIAGHEISHGLTERTAGLVYSGESGGLNEAMSDIFGAGVEWYAAQKNPSIKFNWTVGEAAWTPTDNNPNDGLRYMNDPTKDGYSVDHYSNYPKQTEVHGSSGIANNAFYLLVNGGKNRTSGLEVKDGIGMDKGLKIYYRALAHYMTPKTNFAQARQACIQAATDLYGATSAEVQKVKDSWTAVGVK